MLKNPTPYSGRRFGALTKLLALGTCLAGMALTLFAETTKVACIGDSITFGYLIPQRESVNYPKVLSELLGEEFEVRNFGNSGKTCGDYPSQKKGRRWLGDNKEHKAASDWEADIYICNLGINDTGAWWDPKLFTEGYERLIRDWYGKRKNVSLFMWTKLAPDFRGPDGKKTFPGNIYKPQYAFPARDNGSAKNRPQAQELLEKLAKKVKAIPMDAYSPLCDHPEMYLPDGLHPNAKGARRIAEFTFAKLATSKIPGVKIKNFAPKMEADKETNCIVLKNTNDSAILLDGASLRGSGAAVFEFTNATVIPPKGEIVVQLGGDKDQNDPGFKLTSSKIKTTNGVRFVPAKKR